MPSLTRAEAATREHLITVESVVVHLDLDQGREVFGSMAVLSFQCREPGSSSFVDLRPQSIASIRLNGEDVDPTMLVDGRLPLEGLAADNVLEVDTTMAYSHDGQGLHRSTDPADGEDYVYGHLFLDAAPTVFACFDQPDLKAPYTVTVSAPRGWTVIGNGAATQAGRGRWELATTPPLATYFVTVCAGPWASVTAEHDGIPLGIHARRSLGEHLQEQADQMLDVTRAALDHYHRLFGIRYPFGDYHQVFVPEFNAGAMENPGCVTFRDTYIFRGAATPDQILVRDNTIAHEMAHMWFGDLVTMRWWDDLWLNESFAEYMAYRVLTALGATDAWVEFGIIRKLWGYAADRAPSTHPVAGAPAPDAISALGNFDGISYAKGASVLRQLIVHIGDDAFVRGVGDYLRSHEFGNGELAEFLAAMERASGASLEAWADAWLRTSGADRFCVDRAGLLTREAPPAHPAERPHTLDVAAFAGGREVLHESVVLQARTTSMRLDAVADLPGDAMVVPNAGDLTWAEVTLDDTSRGRLALELSSVPDASARSVVWVSLFGSLARAEVDPRLVLDVFDGAWWQESDAAVLSRVATLVAGSLVPMFLPEEEQEDALRRVAATADRLLERGACTGGASGEGFSVVAARVWARAGSDTDRLRRWARGDGIPAPLAGDDDFRWLVLRRLSSLGELTSTEIDAAEESDRSLAGRLAAHGVRAVRPTPEAKEWAWSSLRDDVDLSNYAALEIASGFWVSRDRDLVRPYVDRVGDLLVGMSSRMGDDALSRVVAALHPTRLAEERSGVSSKAMLAREDLTPGVRRALVDADHALGEALQSRRRFG